MSRVLVVEDCPVQAQLVRHVLEQEGFEVVVAPDAERGRDLFDAADFDLVLSDIVLPGRSGYDLCRLIKAHPARGQVPVVLLTMLHDPLDIIRGIECGADNFLTKPCDPQALLARLRNLFAGRVVRAGSTRRAGDELSFPGRTFVVHSEKEQMLDLLIAACEDIVRTNRQLKASQEQLRAAQTEVERANARLRGQVRSSEEKYRALMEQANDAHFILDPSGQVLEVNRRAEELLGRPATDLRGEAFAGWLAPAAEQGWWPTLLAGEAVRADGVRFLAARDRPVWADLSASGVAVGGERFLLVIARDCRERFRAEQAHARLAAFVASSADAIIGKTLDGTITSWNQAAERIFGHVAAEVLGQSVAVLIPPDQPNEEPAILERLRRGERIEHYETTRLRKDGTRVEVSLSVSPIKDAAGQVLEVASIARDITRQKTAAAALRESEQRFRQVTESIQEVFWLRDARSGDVLYVSPAYEAIWGRSRQSLHDDPRSYLEAVHAEDRDRVAAAFDRRRMTGESEEEYRIVRPDGSLRWIRDRGYPVGDPHGGVERFVGVAEDVTARKGAEAERADLLARLRMQIDRMPLAYLLFDADLRLTDWNAAAERIFGYRKEEVLGMGPPFARILPAAAWPQTEELLGRLRSGDMFAHTVLDNLTKDGRTIACEWSNTPLLDAAGTFVGLLSLAQDVTQQRLLEEQLRQAQKMEAVGQLAGGVAHDFNNLLTIINGYSELVLRGLRADDPLRELVDEVRKAGEQSASLTRQLLAFSRKQVVQPRLLDLNAVAAAAEKMLRRVLGEDVRLSVRLQPGLGLVKADPGQVEQVVLNLAVNARDAMPQGGKLTIETRDLNLDADYAHWHAAVRPGPYVLLAVSDTGQGMTAAVQARIFEPFFTTKGPGQGTGLGLATVFGIVKQSGGHVEVYSEVGVGTSFKVYLPRAEAAGPPAQPVADLPPPRGTETVLLVEDEEAVRALTRHILSGCGYQVLEAADGGEALRVAQRHGGPIHLLVTDVVMPGMGGRQLAERLLAEHPETRVLYLSGYTDDAVVRHGVLHEQVHFLQKPFATLDLARKVREVLDSPQGD